RLLLRRCSRREGRARPLLVHPRDGIEHGDSSCLPRSESGRRLQRTVVGGARLDGGPAVLSALLFFHTGVKRSRLADRVEVRAATVLVAEEPDGFRADGTRRVRLLRRRVPRHLDGGPTPRCRGSGAAHGRPCAHVSDRVPSRTGTSVHLVTRDPVHGAVPATPPMPPTPVPGHAYPPRQS